MKKIYIILTYTGTITSKLVRLFTKYEYSHVSISLDKNIDYMYSFGRKGVHNIFNAGFIKETKNSKFFKVFNKTKCIILEILVDNKKYKKLIKVLKKYEDNKDIYRYDTIGLFLRIFKLTHKRKNYFVCTEFVGSVLKEAEIYDFNKKIIKPYHFLNIPNNKVIYKGNLLEY